LLDPTKPFAYAGENLAAHWLRSGGATLIVMKSKESRRIIGRLDTGNDIYIALKELCRTQELLTAEIRGVGYLSSARLAVYDPDAATFIEDEEAMGPVQVLSLMGNVSQRKGEPSLHLQTTLCLLGPKGGAIRGGRLLSGLVADFEFVIDTIDDFALVREYDKETGLYPWLNIVPKDGHISSDDEIDRTDFLPGRLGARPSEDEPEYELNADDTLVHPRLGTCTLLSADDDRASIRLENGRIVELHLGLLRLQRISKSPKGHQTFEVIVRKRND
jgi:predicted DNA-binding protein with PD1-like motif